jgi:hypothetical protein
MSPWVYSRSSSLVMSLKRLRIGSCGRGAQRRARRLSYGAACAPAFKKKKKPDWAMLHWTTAAYLGTLLYTSLGATTNNVF